MQFFVTALDLGVDGALCSSPDNTAVVVPSSTRLSKALGNRESSLEQLRCEVELLLRWFVGLLMFTFKFQSH